MTSSASGQSSRCCRHTWQALNARVSAPILSSFLSLVQRRMGATHCRIRKSADYWNGKHGEGGSCIRQVSAHGDIADGQPRRRMTDSWTPQGESRCSSIMVSVVGKIIGRRRRHESSEGQRSTQGAGRAAVDMPTRPLAFQPTARHRGRRPACRVNISSTIITFINDLLPRHPGERMSVNIE